MVEVLLCSRMWLTWCCPHPTPFTHLPSPRLSWLGASHTTRPPSTPLPSAHFHLPVLPDCFQEPQAEGSASPCTHLLSKVLLQGLVGRVGFVSSPFFLSQHHKLWDTQVLRLRLTQGSGKAPTPLCPAAGAGEVALRDSWFQGTLSCPLLLSTPERGKPLT